MASKQTRSKSEGHESENDKGPAGNDDEIEGPDVKPKTYAGEAGNVDNEAKEKKKGGAVKRKRGGRAEKVEGKEPHERADKRARGGGVGMENKGADSRPLSSAADVTRPSGDKSPTINRKTDKEDD